MLDGLITGDLVINTGATALLASVVWMIFTGRLVTRREADEIKAERDYWRAAFNEEQKQSTALLETAKTTQRALDALPRPSEERS